jgi:hypothetical protein
MDLILGIGSIIVAGLSTAIVILNNRITKLENSAVTRQEFNQFEKRFDMICEKIDKLFDIINDIRAYYEPWDGKTERRRKKED